MTATRRPEVHPPDPERSGFLARWWPAVVGVGLVVVALGLVAVTSWLGGDDTEAVSAVRYHARVIDAEDASTDRGSVELELNTASRELCYRVEAPSLARPFSISLTSALANGGGGGVVVDLGRHASGTLGCARADRSAVDQLLAIPESHGIRLVGADGTVVSGSLVYDPSVGDTTDEVADVLPEAVAPVSARDPDKAGFILPDTASSDRWARFDKPLIEEACAEAGIECVVENAEGDPEAMSEIADRMIAEGVSVLAIANLDSESGAAIQQRAAAAGVHNIDYDRLTVGGAAEVYVSFDNVAVGTALGEGLVQCLGSEADGARVIELHGSPDDNNATLFRQGYQAALEAAGVVTVADVAVPDWSATEAETLFDQLLAGEAGGSVDGVLAANDAIAGGARSVLDASGADAAITGQDATPGGLRAILTGEQCMTVYKPVKVEADAVVKAAVALMRGNDPPANATIDNGTAEIPYVQGQITSIFADDVHIPVEDGFVELAELCQGIEDRCREAGIG